MGSTARLGPRLVQDSDRLADGYDAGRKSEQHPLLQHDRHGSGFVQVGPMFQDFVPHTKV